MSKINTGRMGSRTQARPRIRVRILRGHPFYLAGTVLTPPAGARDILLRQRDQLGRPVAEVIADEPSAMAADEATHDQDEAAPEPAAVAQKPAKKK